MVYYNITTLRCISSIYDPYVRRRCSTVYVRTKMRRKLHIYDEYREVKYLASLFDKKGPWMDAHRKLKRALISLADVPLPERAGAAFAWGLPLKTANQNRDQHGWPARAASMLRHQYVDQKATSMKALRRGRWRCCHRYRRHRRNNRIRKK